MECFNSLLLKLREVHEREMEGWQVKIQELSNKKGCDTKRMEELFTKNQQMKEQQRLLTENIKTLENRLRAGLCDRCTVTQQVAKKRQQEFEASQIQSLQHISLLAVEMNNLKMENKKLKDEIRSLKAALGRGHSDHSSSNNSTTTDLKQNSSPELSPSSGVAASGTKASSTNQPADGDVAMKTEVDQQAEESEHRQWRGTLRGHFDSYKSSSTPSAWKTEHGASGMGERRPQSVEGLDQQSPVVPQALLIKDPSSSTSGEPNHSRHVVFSPVPCRPQPVRSGPVALPWPSTHETGLMVQSQLKTNLPHFPNLSPGAQHPSPRRQGFGSLWHTQSSPKPSATEPTVLFRLRSLPEHVESQTKPQERKETSPSRVERVSGKGLREVCEGPLDLSDGGKSKSSQSPRYYSPFPLQGGERVQSSPDFDVEANPSAQRPGSSPRFAVPTSSSSSPHEEEPNGDHKHKQVAKEQEQKEEVNGKPEQSNGKKVPVLTISLRPVVMLETLSSALEKQESLSSKSKVSSSPAVEVGDSTDEHDEGEEDEDELEGASGQESKKSCKRKRASVETETDRDSDTDNVQPDRKIKITVRADEKSST